MLLAQEIVKTYHRKDLGKCTIKVDLKNAYDSVEWKFSLLYHCLIGIPKRYAASVKKCITTPKFSVAIIGGLPGYFKGSKGLKRGNPLSPYLFVLAMEAFTRPPWIRELKSQSFKLHP